MIIIQVNILLESVLVFICNNKMFKDTLKLLINYSWCDTYFNKIFIKLFIVSTNYLSVLSVLKQVENFNIHYIPL